VSDRSLRVVGVALALVASAIHFVLFVADLIPGEPTTVPAFALMGVGFVGCAALVAFARGDLLVVAPIYSISLIAAWAFTRGQYPVEIVGIVSKLAELGLAIVGVLLIRRTSATAGSTAG